MPRRATKPKKSARTSAIKLKARHTRVAGLGGSASNEEAIGRSYVMLASRCRKSEIKTVLKARYKMSNRTIERVLAEARHRIILASGKSEQEHKDDAYALYDSIVRSSRSERFKLHAQERIDKLLAIEGPVKVELSGGIAHQAKIAHQLLSDEATAELLEKLDERFAASSAGADKK